MFTTDSQMTPSFWPNGPTPGALYRFPETKTGGGFQHSQGPITTATSLVALVFDKGVVIAGDLLGSYGSLARYRNCPRILKINDGLILGAGGDYGDFQYVKDLINQKVIEEECLDDGFKLQPKSLHCWLTRVMYNRRSKFDPFWNNFVVAGLQDGVPYLATVDKLGTAFQDKAICTGYGALIALPMVREYLESNAVVTEADAKALVKKCMEVLYYRDARSFPKYQMGVVTDTGVTIETDLTVEQKWDIARMIN